MQRKVYAIIVALVLIWTACDSSNTKESGPASGGLLPGAPGYSSELVATLNAAWASRQSTEIESREALEADFSRCSERFADAQVPAPEFWGGFRVAPAVFEFWQGGEIRLHDRFDYRPIPDGSGWHIRRLAP